MNKVLTIITVVLTVAVEAVVAFFAFTASFAYATPTYPTNPVVVQNGVLYKIDRNSVGYIHYPESATAEERRDIDDCAIEMLRWLKSAKTCPISSQKTYDFTWWGRQYGLEIERVTKLDLSNDVVMAKIAENGVPKEWISNKHAYMLLGIWLLYLSGNWILERSKVLVDDLLEPDWGGLIFSGVAIGFFFSGMIESVYDIGLIQFMSHGVLRGGFLALSGLALVYGRYWYSKWRQNK